MRHEGPLALYRGMSGLALFSVPRFALLWYFFHSSVSYQCLLHFYFKWIRYANCWGRLMVEGDQLNPGQLTMTQVSYDVLELLELLLQILLGGIFSQLVVAPFLVAPLERVKVLLQVNLKASSNAGRPGRSILSTNYRPPLKSVSV